MGIINRRWVATQKKHNTEVSQNLKTVEKWETSSRGKIGQTGEVGETPADLSRGNKPGG